MQLYSCLICWFKVFLIVSATKNTAGDTVDNLDSDKILPPENFNKWDALSASFVKVIGKNGLEAFLENRDNSSKETNSKYKTISNPESMRRYNSTPQNCGVWQAHPLTYHLQMEPDFSDLKFDAELITEVRLQGGLPDNGYIWIEMSARDLDITDVSYYWGSAKNPTFVAVPLYSVKNKEEILQICIPVEPQLQKIKSKDRSNASSSKSPIKPDCPDDQAQSQTCYPENLSSDLLEESSSILKIKSDAQNESISGKKFDQKRQNSSKSWHGQEYLVLNEDVDSKAKTENKEAKTHDQPDSSHTRIKFNRSSRKNYKVFLKIKYSGEISDRDVGGFYVYSKQAVSGTRFDSGNARHVMPCWDDPIIRASFKLTLILPNGLKAFGITPVASIEEHVKEQLDDKSSCYCFPCLRGSNTTIVPDPLSSSSNCFYPFFSCLEKPSLKSNNKFPASSSFPTLPFKNHQIPLPPKTPILIEVPKKGTKIFKTAFIFEESIALPIYQIGWFILRPDAFRSHCLSIRSTDWNIKSLFFRPGRSFNLPEDDVDFVDGNQSKSKKEVQEVVRVVIHTHPYSPDNGIEFVEDVIRYIVSYYFHLFGNPFPEMDINLFVYNGAALQFAVPGIIQLPPWVVHVKDPLNGGVSVTAKLQCTSTLASAFIRQWTASIPFEVNQYFGTTDTFSEWRWLIRGIEKYLALVVVEKLLGHDVWAEFEIEDVEDALDADSSVFSSPLQSRPYGWDLEKVAKKSSKSSVKTDISRDSLSFTDDYGLGHKQLLVDDDIDLPTLSDQGSSSTFSSRIEPKLEARIKHDSCKTEESDQMNILKPKKIKSASQVNLDHTNPSVLNLCGTLQEKAADSSNFDNYFTSETNSSLTNVPQIKGAALLRMITPLLVGGEKTLFRCIRDKIFGFNSENIMKPVDFDLFLDALDDETIDYGTLKKSTPVGKILVDWATRRGYPHLSVSLGLSNEDEDSLFNEDTRSIDKLSTTSNFGEQSTGKKSEIDEEIEMKLKKSAPTEGDQFYRAKAPFRHKILVKQTRFGPLNEKIAESFGNEDELEIEGESRKDSWSSEMNTAEESWLIPMKIKAKFKGENEFRVIESIIIMDSLSMSIPIVDGAQLIVLEIFGGYARIEYAPSMLQVLCDFVKNYDEPHTSESHPPKYQSSTCVIHEVTVHNYEDTKSKPKPPKPNMTLLSKKDRSKILVDTFSLSLAGHMLLKNSIFLLEHGFTCEDSPLVWRQIDKVIDKMYAATYDGAITSHQKGDGGKSFFDESGNVISDHPMGPGVSKIVRKLVDYPNSVASKLLARGMLRGEEREHYDSVFEKSPFPWRQKALLRHRHTVTEKDVVIHEERYHLMRAAICQLATCNGHLETQRVTNDLLKVFCPEDIKVESDSAPIGMSGSGMDQYRKYGIKNSSMNMNVEVRHAVLAHGIREGDVDVFNNIVDYYRTLRAGWEKSRILEILAGTPNPLLMSQVLKLSEEDYSFTMFRIIQAFVRANLHPRVLWTLISERWTEILYQLAKSGFSYTVPHGKVLFILVSIIVNYACSNEVKAFVLKSRIPMLRRLFDLATDQKSRQERTILHYHRLQGRSQLYH